MINTFKDTFKELNLTQLEILAEEWATKFSIEFDRIILFKDLNPRRALHEHVFGGSVPGRYLILLELSESAFKDMIQAEAEGDGILYERYDRLSCAIGQYHTMLDPNIETDRKMLRDNLHRVYKNKSDYIQDDWDFRVKDPDKDLPLGVKEEIGYFWVLYDLNKKDLPTVDIRDETTEPCPEDFIKSLSVYYENNNEIKIQLPGNRAGCITCQSLGFRDNTTKAWTTFIEILQNPTKTYYIGPAYNYVQVYGYSDKTEDEERKPEYSQKGGRKPEYDRRYKRLGEISKKIAAYLNDHYSVQIPSDYKLYELCPDEKTGTFKFKFQTMGDKKESEKDQVLGKFERLTEKYRKTENGSLIEKISELALIILDHKWLTNDEIENAIRPDKSHGHDTDN